MGSVVADDLERCCHDLANFAEDMPQVAADHLGGKFRSGERPTSMRP